MELSLLAVVYSKIVSCRAVPSGEVLCTGRAQMLCPTHV